MATADADSSRLLRRTHSASWSWFGWLGLRVAGHPVLSLHLSDEHGELSQWLCHDDRTINYNGY